MLLFAPWVAFLPGALWRSWKTFNKQEWVIWYWIVGAVIVFSLVGQKKDYYLLPLYPALSLLVAWWWDSRRAAVGDRSWAIPYRLL